MPGRSHAWGKSTGPSEAVDLAQPENDLAAASQVAAREVDYPFIHEVHSASSIVVEPAKESPRMLENLGPIPEKGCAISQPEKWPEASMTTTRTEAEGYQPRSWKPLSRWLRPRRLRRVTQPS